jgi:hypothetical protein
MAMSGAAMVRNERVRRTVVLDICFPSCLRCAWSEWQARLDEDLDRDVKDLSCIK